MKLNDRIKELRLQRGLSAKAVADQAGLSPSFVTELEKGRTNPSLDTLIALARLFKISVIDFLIGVDFAGDPSEQSIPSGLAELLTDSDFAGEIDKDWQRLLEKIEIYGKRPSTKRDWMAVYLCLKQVLEHLD